jgi:uncharacterized phosphosugar-binding protein
VDVSWLLVLDIRDMFAEELFVRAGGFGQVYPILPSEFQLHEHPLKSTEVERVEENANVIMKIY